MVVGRECIHDEVGWNEAAPAQLAAQLVRRLVFADDADEHRLAPRVATLRATFAAPPGMAAVRSIAMTGIGASGEMRSTEP